MTRQGRSWTKRAAFALVVVAILYGTLELFAWGAFWMVTGERFSFEVIRAEQEKAGAPPAENEPTENFTADIALHPFLGYVFDQSPDAGGEGHGFFNPEGPLRHRGPDRLVVGIFGGSVAMEMAQQAAQALSDALTVHPAFRGRTIEVVNLALFGYRQPQQLLTLEYILALGGELDLVINLDGFNEVAYTLMNNKNQIYPPFPHFWNQLAAQRPVPEIRRALGRIEHLESNRRGLARFFAATPLPSVTLGLLWKTTDNALNRAIASNKVAIAQVPAGDSFAMSGPTSPATTADDLMAEATQRWFRCSVQMQRTCEANGIRYFHFLQPNQYVLGSKPLSETEQRNAYLESQLFVPSVRFGYPIVREMAHDLRGAGVAFHDLTLLFEQTEETVYADNCCHFNQGGYDHLARTIASFIVADADARPYGDNQGEALGAMLRLTCTPSDVRLTRPLEIVQLDLRAQFENGATLPVTHHVALRSSNDEVVRVLHGARIEAGSPGDATVLVEYHDQQIPVTVSVRHAPVTQFGRGKHGRAGVVPELRGTLTSEALQVEVDHARAGATGVLVASKVLARHRWCSMDLFVQFDAVGSTPFTTSGSAEPGGGRAAFEVPLGVDIGGTVYWQAFVRDEAAACGWSATNGMAVTR